MRNQRRSGRSVSQLYLDYPLLGSTLAKVRDADAWWAEKGCLLFIGFTCARSGEARLANWDEIDLDESTWTIPASHMKTDREHRVPLSTQAKELLAHAREPDRPQREQNFPPSTWGRVHSKRQALQAPEKAGDTDGATRIQGQLHELGRGTRRHRATRRGNGLGPLPDRARHEGHDQRLLQGEAAPYAGVGRLLDRDHGTGHTHDADVAGSGQIPSGLLLHMALRFTWVVGK